MTDTDDLPTWSGQLDDSLPPLGESPALAAARRSQGKASAGLGSEEGPTAGAGAAFDPSGLSEQVLAAQKPRRRPPAFLAPLLVLAAGFGAGILLASAFVDVGGGDVAAQGSDQGLAGSGDPGLAGSGDPGSVGSGDQGLAGSGDQASGQLADDAPGTATTTTVGPGAQEEELQLAPLILDDDERNFITADRYEVRFGSGLLYLTGILPDKETADVIIERAGAIVGPDNLIVDHTFDPSMVLEPDIEIPIVVEDVVYFNTGSATIAPEFYPLIDLGVLLLRLNPQASITVLTYTDASGSEEANLELSRQRGQAVKDYLVFMGGNPDQLLLDPRGEEGAIEGVSAEIAAEERRAEFILNGFLNGLFDE